MLTPTFLQMLRHYYPVGNTPSISLTQALPPGKDAKILLLGCGDLRNILFTAYNDGPKARNILLLTLIIDDTEGQNSVSYWNIFYHLYLNGGQIQIVHDQAKKLRDLAISLQTWNESEYAKHIRFCDKGSLTMVRRIWDFWFTGTGDNKGLGIKQVAESSIERGRAHKSGPNRHQVSGFRSAGPASLSAIAEMTKLHKHFWEYGTTDTEHKKMAKAKQPNPMFASLDNAITLHYGTDPLLGYHAAIAKIPLAGECSQSKKGLKKVHPLVASARAEFSAWADAFRNRAPDTFVLRIFAGDAIALCNTLKFCQINGDSSASWYRRQNLTQQLVLDADVTDSGHISMPTSFNVIDTSNLADHLGGLNLLVAASPLLDHDVASTIYTEVLRPVDQTRQGIVKEMLSGPFSTVSLLLGLFHVAYWTNTSSLSGNEEALLAMASTQENSQEPIKKQMFVRSAWKRPVAYDGGQRPQPLSSLLPMHFDVNDLARILHQVFEHMFWWENLEHVRSRQLNSTQVRKMAMTLYRRSSFVAFLKLVKTRVNVDWNQTMRKLLQTIESDPRPSIAAHFLQELYLYMHLLGVYTTDTLCVRYNEVTPSIPYNDIRDWSGMPSIVCVILKVPRQMLTLFTNMNPVEVGTPAFHCSLRNSEPLCQAGAWQDFFASVQISFGELSTSGTRHTADFRVHIAEDSRGWHGDSDMLVSFWAPTAVLLKEPRTSRVSLAFQPAPLLSVDILLGLGKNLTIYETTLGCTTHVYITKDLPNQNGVLAVPGFSALDIAKPGMQNAGVETSIRVGLEEKQTAGHISFFTGRFDIRSNDLLSQLTGGCQVETNIISPCSITVSVGERLLRIDFPFPVDGPKCTARVARKSSYIELIAPISEDMVRKPFQALTYPVIFSDENLTSWNLPYINYQVMPVIDVSKGSQMSWLQDHLNMMASKRERVIQKINYHSASDQEKARLGHKETMLTLLVDYAVGFGEEQRHRIFVLKNPSNGGSKIVVIVSSLRLDLSNRTVVIDAAVLPVYEDISLTVNRFLRQLILSGEEFMNIESDEVELRLWKQILPAYIERCRTWDHRADCKYRVRGQIPLSVDENKEVLCVCGNGFFPLNFCANVPNWNEVSKYAVRAAISPMFWSPLVEDGWDSLEARHAMA
ncbi:hypothetical protein CCHL11_07336 [Colletotrichum chlorophyti]|uniref:DUF4470 domain-containing protein n=1 Tax=Colletotrichum chlorophyti TaxID=708187 RepID=A0A1Q8RA58_9PEZI|nr:hypothetical protein CCHL11_07336 [Colletotrichum chlorophyti]